MGWQEATAMMVVKTLENYDPYSFHDEFDSEEEAYEQVLRDIRDGGQLTIIGLCNHINELMED